MKNEDTDADLGDSDELRDTVLAGRYQVAQVVSAGASTVLVDAIDIETDRPVNVKIVRPELARHADFRRKFRRLAEISQALTHPNIASVTDWGEIGIGNRSTVFWTVDALGGGSMRDLLDRGRLLAPGQALVVGLEACRALDAAHQKGLFHTELNPSKMVFGVDRRLRVVDFGMARLIAEPNWADIATVPTHVARYASPEQALGLPIDSKTDVYALALVLIEAVTGAVPFAADSTVATLAARVDRLMPVSADLGGLASVLERAGRPESADRFTAAEFGRALVQVAPRLSKPEPIPIIATGLFDSRAMRRPADPTGGVDRPAPAAGLAGVDDATDVGAPAPPKVGVVPSPVVPPVAPMIPGDALLNPRVNRSADAVRSRSKGSDVAREDDRADDGDGANDGDGEGDGVPPGTPRSPSPVDAAPTSTGLDAPDDGVPSDDRTPVDPDERADEDGSPPGARGVAADDPIDHDLIDDDPTGDVTGDDFIDDDPIDDVTGDDLIEEARDGDLAFETSADGVERGPDRSVPGDRSPAEPAVDDDGESVAESTDVPIVESAVAQPDTVATPSPGGVGPGVVVDDTLDDSVDDATGVRDDDVSAADDITDVRDDDVPAADDLTEDDVTDVREDDVTTTDDIAEDDVINDDTPDDDTIGDIAAHDVTAADIVGERPPGDETAEEVPSHDDVLGDEESDDDVSSGGDAPVDSSPPGVVTDEDDIPNADAPGTDGSVADQPTTSLPATTRSHAGAAGDDGDVDVTDETSGRRRGPAILLVALLVVGLAGLAYAGALLFSTKSFEVPSLAGVSEEQALAQVDGNDWEIVRERERSDPFPEPDTVIRTIPGPGVDVDEGDEFTLVLSDGPEFRTLPDFAEMTFEAATARLDELGLDGRGAAGRSFSESVEPGSIVSWQVDGDPDLAAGGQILPGETIVLTLSKGPEPRTVPDLAGRTEAEAEQALDDLRLDFARGDDVFSDDVPSGQVVSQAPAAGESIEREATVTVQISKGPDVVALPDLEGLSYPEAETALREAGYSVGTLLGTTEGTFIEASVDGEEIATGREFPRGQAVDLIFL